MTWQPPAYTPVPAGALVAGLGAWLSRPDPRSELAARLGSRYDARAVHLTSSGTVALEIAIRLARVASGGSAVALPAFACFDVATAAVGSGARIALYDLDPATLGPDPDSLTQALAAGARTVVVAPIAGLPVDWDDVQRCAAAFGAVIVEDAAQGHGAQWRGRPLGSYGALSVLSFSRGKGWTGGRGGAVLVRDAALAEFARGLTLVEPSWMDDAGTLALAAAQAAFSHPSRYGLAASLPFLHLGETRYRDPRPLARMTRTAAAVLLAGEFAANVEVATRRETAARLIAALAERRAPVTAMTIARGASPGFLRLPVRLGRAGRSAPDAALRPLGVGPAYPSTLDQLPPVHARLIEHGRWPGATTLVRELVTLPTHSRITPAVRDAIVDRIAPLERVSRVAPTASHAGFPTLAR